MADVGFFQRLQHTFNSGDKEIATWFLVRHNYLPFIMCASYALFSSLVGPAIMRNRKPFDLRKTMIVFNFFIVATYATCLFIIFWYLPNVSWDHFCKGHVVNRDDLSYMLMRTCWVLYMLKYVEFFDTVFFVLRKKENLITFLHVMHHTIVPILGWILFRTERSAFQSVPVLLNCFVHVIMYSYYGLAAMGPRVRKYLWWKKYLTQLQIIQFFLMIVFVTVVAPLSGCSMNSASYLMDIFLAPLFFYLFFKFYQSNFTSEKKTEENGRSSPKMASKENGTGSRLMALDENGPSLRKMASKENGTGSRLTALDENGSRSRKMASKENGTGSRLTALDENGSRSRKMASKENGTGSRLTDLDENGTSSQKMVPKENGKSE